MRSKNKLILFIYAIALIIGATAICFFVNNNIQNFEQIIINQIQQHLLNIAKSESIHFERFINDVRDDLKMLALTPQIQNDLVHAHEHNHPLKNISATEEYEAANIMYDHFAGRINAIYAIDTKGIVKCSVPSKTVRKNADYSEKPGIKSVIKNQQPYVSELFNTNSGHHAISVCVPVFEDEKFIGILRALVHTETMRDCLNDSKIGKKGYAWMIDDSGIMISHPKTEHIGKHKMAPRKDAFPDYDWFELENIVAKMTSGQSGVGIYHSAWWLDEKPGLVRKLIAFAPVGIGNELWSIGVSMGYDEISGPIKAHTRNLFLGAGFIILLFTGAGVGFFRVQKRHVELQVQVKSAEQLKSINEKLLSEITERRKVEQKLKQTAEEWTSTFDSIRDLVSIQDKDFKYIKVNKAFADAFKIKPEDAVGKICYELVHKTETPWPTCPHKEALNTEIPRIAEFFESRLGLYLEISASPILSKDGEVVGSVHIAKDITERKIVEEKQVKLIKQIENINCELKDFASIVSHDLKAPLRGIKTLANWILSDEENKLGKQANEQMNLLLERVELMYSLIEGVLQYSIAGRPEGKRVQVNLNDFVPEIINMVVPPENISVTIEDELPVFECEEIHVMQIFQNLLSNAIKYMDKPQGHIQIGCVEQDGFWKFSVADNGPGIEEKHFERIFKIFQALPTSPDFEGTGVGLTITKKLVELYNGKVWLESKVGEGSTFFFTLPKHEIEASNEKLKANIAC